MSIVLRPYQEDMIAATRVALRSSKRVLVQAPTGAGKTALGATMMGSAAQRGAPSLFIVHRQELIKQTAATFDKVGIKYGYCAAGYDYNPYAPTLICGIDTLKNRVDQLFGRKFIMWDEAHHAAAAGWAKVAAAFPEAFHVGLSATPERLDGKGLNGQFDVMIPGPRVNWLISQGFLCRYRAFAPTTPDIRSVKTIAGDYDKHQLGQVLDGSTLMGDIVSHYMRLSLGRRAVAFCHSVEASMKLAAEFNSKGVKAAHLDGDSDKREGKGTRERIVDMFRNGEIDVLCNVDLFGEGFDLPAMETVILGRPTQSLALFMQQVGRGLRPFDGKDYCLILDHAGMLAMHGLPDEDREWSLLGREKKKKGKVKMLTCPKCFHCHEPQSTCPECGHRYEAAGSDGMGGRIVDQVDGDLQEVDIEASRKAVRREQGMAQTIEELVAIATARGSKSPEQWAAYVWTGREAAKRRREQELEQQAEFYRR